MLHVSVPWTLFKSGAISFQPSQQKYGDTTFHRVASNRMLSLEERKQIMLETARQRYKEKHGLV